MNAHDPTPQSVSPADYVAAISQHVSSVTIIATEESGMRYGLTATAIASVTADPPRILICVNKTGKTHEKIVQSGRFSVNVLTEAQDGIAMAFAGMGGPSADRFAQGSWDVLKTGAPVLANAAAVFDCLVAEAVDQSTHTVFFGNVVATTHLKGQDTLLYGVRRFRQLRKVFIGPGDGSPDYL